MAIKKKNKKRMVSKYPGGGRVAVLPAKGDINPINQIPYSTRTAPYIVSQDATRNTRNYIDFSIGTSAPAPSNWEEIWRVLTTKGAKFTKPKGSELRKMSPVINPNRTTPIGIQNFQDQREGEYIPPTNTMNYPKEIYRGGGRLYRKAQGGAQLDPWGYPVNEEYNYGTPKEHIYRPITSQPNSNQMPAYNTGAATQSTLPYNFSPSMPNRMSPRFSNQGVGQASYSYRPTSSGNQVGGGTPISTPSNDFWNPYIQSGGYNAPEQTNPMYNTQMMPISQVTPFRAGTPPMSGGAEVGDKSSWFSENTGMIASGVNALGSTIARGIALSSMPKNIQTPKITYNPLRYRSSVDSIRRANEAALSRFQGTSNNPYAQVGAFSGMVQANNQAALQDQQARNQFDAQQRGLAYDANRTRAALQSQTDRFNTDLGMQRVQSGVNAVQATSQEIQNIVSNAQLGDMQSKAMLLQLFATTSPADIAKAVSMPLDQLLKLVGLPSKYRGMINK